MFQSCTSILLNTSFPTLFKIFRRKFSPRRAMMYVPANDLKKVLKAFMIDVDCVMLDCEDGVDENLKVEARKNIRDLLELGKPVKKRKYDFAVRVNSVSSQLLKDDLSAILLAKNNPDTIFLPKVESLDDIKVFSGFLDEFITKKKKVGLILGVSTAQGLINLDDIVTIAKEMSESSKFILKALTLLGDDFRRSIGAKRTESVMELLYARQKIISLAKAFNLQAIDIVYTKYKDLKGFKQEALEAAHMGFSGKQLIHPDQVKLSHEAFTPSKKDIEWAHSILNAFHKHEQEGHGMFEHSGLMIDMAVLRQAEYIMDIMNALQMQ